jgi:hypothetical protein
MKQYAGQASVATSTDCDDEVTVTVEHTPPTNGDRWHYNRRASVSLTLEQALKLAEMLTEAANRLIERKARKA